MGRQYRNMAVVGQSFCMCRLENRGSIALVAGDGNDDINVEVTDKLVDGLEKILSD